MQTLPDLQQAAAAELLSRRLARQSFIHFASYVDRSYHAEPFHVLVAQTLDRVVSGEIKKLLIFAPPQHGKSRLVSELFPAYWLGRRPDDPVLLASYAAGLAHSKSRIARDLILDTPFRGVFGNLSPYDVPRDLRDDSRAVDEWRLAQPHRGGLRAAGVGGGLTGHPGVLGIIDDPFSNWEEAQSLTIRNKVYDWYRSVFRTRIWETGAIVMIMTRWHEDDIAGRLLKSQGDEWHVLRLPAIAETQDERDLNDKYLGQSQGQSDPLGREAGEPLAPMRFSKTALGGLKRDVGSLVWAAEYQGVPRPPEGNRFKRSWYPIVRAAPKDAVRVRYWDKGGTKDGGAFTAGVLVAVTLDGFIYIEDVKRGQWSSHERERVIKQTAILDAEKYGAEEMRIYIEQEPGSGGKESAENTIRNLQGFNIARDLPSGNKDVRLEPFAAQSEAGNVSLVRGLWNEDWLDEMAAIPNSSYRDQADATAGAYNKAIKLGEERRKAMVYEINFTL